MVEASGAPAASRLWVSRVMLTDFRSYPATTIEVGPPPVVLIGPNGAGKTNLLEAISLLAPGTGLRRAAYAEIGRIGGDGTWSVAAEVETPAGRYSIGTGVKPQGRTEGGRPGRIVRIDGQTVGPAALAEHVEMVWLTPSMDSLFTGPAAERRRFLDRLILCFDASYAAIAARFERAMRQRNRLLDEGSAPVAQLAGLELQMAETGVAIAAARSEAVAAMTAIIATRRLRSPHSAFPWAHMAIEGEIEQALASRPAIEVEDDYRERLALARERDRSAGRTLDGPHRSDLIVGHGPKGMPARLSSTGEQKALLMGLVLAHAELLAGRREGAAPVLLLDEIAAHFDEDRRTALFAEILRLGAQAWMTGTDRSAFSVLESRAAFMRVEAGRVESL